MRALITGITGQDGSYLAELLLEKGYEVYGLMRPNSNRKPNCAEDICERIQFVRADLTNQQSIDQIVQQLQPNELYNLAAHSFVPASWNQPVLTADVTGLGPIRLLEGLRAHSPKTT